MNGIKIKVDKSRVESITDENGNDLKWVKHITIDLDATEYPRVMLEIQPEFVDIEVLDTLIYPELNEEALKAIAAHHGYKLIASCDDETRDVAIEQELGDQP